MLEGRNWDYIFLRSIILFRQLTDDKIRAESLTKNSIVYWGEQFMFKQSESVSLLS